MTSDPKKPYLISEYNGHMYPTKAFDWEEHRAEHALRHVRVLDAAAAECDIAGSFGWCMFDYNTQGFRQRGSHLLPRRDGYVPQSEAGGEGL